MKARLLLVGFCLAAVLAEAAEWNRSFTVGANPQLRVMTDDASIEVRAVPGNSVSAKVTTRGYNIGPADVKITDRQVGDLVEITVKIPHRAYIMNLGNQWVRIEVTAPPSTKLEIQADDGSLHATGFKAPANLRTSDGSVEVREHDGVLHAKTFDGSIRVQGRFDDLDLATGDGRIECTVARGSKLAADWRVRTTDGSVELRLPPELAAELDVSTGDGSLQFDLPVSAATQSKSALRGKLNGGGRMFQVRTADGSIRVLRN